MRTGFEFHMLKIEPTTLSHESGMVSPLRHRKPMRKALEGL